MPFVKKEKDNLKAYCQARYHQIEWGYVEGFWGGKQDLKIPAYLAQVIDSLSDLAGVYATLEKKLENRSDLDEVAKSLEHTDKMAEKAIAFIIENSVLPRIDNITRAVN